MSRAQLWDQALPERERFKFIKSLAIKALLGAGTEAIHGFCNTRRSLTKRLMVEGWTRKIRATFL
jgi:hypothetical protein